MVIKELVDNTHRVKNQFSKNIKQYMRKALEEGNTIYFYAIDPTERKSNVDKLSWIRDLKHEEYDMVAINYPDTYYNFEDEDTDLSDENMKFINECFESKEEYVKFLEEYNKHKEEYLKARDEEIKSLSSKKIYCQSRILGDKVIKLDLTDKDVKNVFNEKFKIGIKWPGGNIPCRIGDEDPLFIKEMGYDFYNFIVTKDDEIVMDAPLYGGFETTIAISDNLVDEVDKEVEDKRRKRWRRIIFPFSRQ